MIRNREAAINSRRKKKEYLSRLETRIQNLTTLATNLSEENRQLKSMIIETGVDKLWRLYIIWIWDAYEMINEQATFSINN